PNVRPPETLPSAPSLATATAPPFSVVPPDQAFAPLRVSVPPPCFTRPPVPVIAAASVVSTLLLVVSVPLPSESVPPLPDSAPTVWWLLLRSKVPPLTASAPLRRSTLLAPSRKVPELTVVPPL